MGINNVSELLSTVKTADTAEQLSMKAAGQAEGLWSSVPRWYFCLKLD